MMIFGEDKQRIDFYQNSKRGKILRAMTLNDVTYWGADAFIVVIFALFVVNFIEGGSATHVGLVFFVYNLARALFSIPVGQFFDDHRGFIDEVWGLAATSFVAGSVYMLLSQASQLWHLYIAMLALGLVSAVNLTSWRVLFYNNIDRKEYGQTIGIYQTAVAVAYSLAAALGGIAGDQFGFDIVVLIGGLAMFAGGLIPLTIQRYFKKSSRT